MQQRQLIDNAQLKQQLLEAQDNLHKSLALLPRDTILQPCPIRREILLSLNYITQVIELLEGEEEDRGSGR